MKRAKIAILGFGREGRAVFEYIRKWLDKARGAKSEITIHDENDGTVVPRGASSRLGKDYLGGLNQYDIIYRTPGIPYLTPQIQGAIKAGVKVTSATKLFFDEVSAMPASRRPTIIGITGTKGKGTTCTLLYEILKSAKRDVHLAGNIGKPVLEILPSLRAPSSARGNLIKNTFAILELSSFQLQDLDKSPKVAVVLDIFPDHMDSHGSFGEYTDAKSNIARHQKPTDKIFYFSENKHSSAIATLSRGKKIPVSVAGFKLFSPKDLKIHGPHNFKNSVMAANVALSLGVPRKVIVAAIKKFRGLEHRLEYVRSIGGVKFYNDSGGSNPNTAAAAVRSFNEPIVLIAGGKDKNLDYAPLAQSIRESGKVKEMILFGENKEKIRIAMKELLDGGLLSVETRDDLKAAVKTAFNYAETLVAGGYPKVVVVFSPGAASFDMFRDYADRGEQFKKIVSSLG